MKKNVWQIPKSSPYLQRSLVLDNDHLLVQVPKRSGILWKKENSSQGIWDHIAEKMLVEFAESGCPIFRVTAPLSKCKLKSKRHGKLSIHFAADQETIETILKSKGHGKLSIHFTAGYPTIETIFRIIVSANLVNLYGAVANTVANMCEECESLHDRSKQPDVVMGQSFCPQ